jgi:hypothetical protein
MFAPGQVPGDSPDGFTASSSSVASRSSVSSRVGRVGGAGGRYNRSGRQPLGKNAKFGTPVDGNGKTLADDGGEGIPVENGRRRRFRLQSRARYLLRNSRRKDRKGEDQPYRINNCLLAPGFQSSGAGVAKMQVPSEAGVDSVAVYRSLQICGSVWHCPVCAARVANERVNEIRQAQLLAAGLGYKTVLVTLTARHDRKTILKDQLAAMTEAYRGVWRGESAKRLKEEFDIFGMIRTLECTHGKNGWHPHIHILMFVPFDCDIVGFASALRFRWEMMALKYGLTMNKHGFDIQDNTDKVAAYIAKWGHDPCWTEADELARWHTKIGRGRESGSHYTPWQLLDFADNGDSEAGELWREYAVTFYRRKQLHWSRGLRKKLGMEEELTDEEAAQKEIEGATTDYEIKLNTEQWNWIKGNDMRVELLELVEKCSADDIIDRCRQEYGFEPELFIPSLEQGSALTDEDREALRIAEMVRLFELRIDRRVVTPDGLGTVSMVTKCPILKRWRCSVILEAGGVWRAFDLAQIKIA